LVSLQFVQKRRNMSDAPATLKQRRFLFSLIRDRRLCFETELTVGQIGQFIASAKQRIKLSKKAGGLK